MFPKFVTLKEKLKLNDKNLVHNFSLLAKTVIISDTRGVVFLWLSLSPLLPPPNLFFIHHSNASSTFSSAIWGAREAALKRMASILISQTTVGNRRGEVSRGTNLL